MEAGGGRKHPDTPWDGLYYLTSLCTKRRFEDWAWKLVTLDLFGSESGESEKKWDLWHELRQCVQTASTDLIFGLSRLTLGSLNSKITCMKCVRRDGNHQTETTTTQRTTVWNNNQYLFFGLQCITWRSATMKFGALPGGLDAYVVTTATNAGQIKVRISWSKKRVLKGVLKFPNSLHMKVCWPTNWCHCHITHRRSTLIWMSNDSFNSRGHWALCCYHLLHNQLLCTKPQLSVTAHDSTLHTAGVS